jgi:hypothetical protein
MSRASLISVYFLVSIVLAVSALSHAGWTAGLSTIATSLLSLIAGVRLRQIISHETDWSDLKGRRFDMAIGGIVTSVAVIILAQWLGTKFSLHLFDYTLDGWQWGWIGFAIAFVYLPKRGRAPDHASPSK